MIRFLVNRRSILFLSALLALSPATLAQDASRQAGRSQHRMAKAGKALGLTGEQREQIKARAAAHKDAMSGLREAEKAARAELKRVVTATPGDAEAVRSAARSVSAARENLTAARAARRAEVRSVLTPEQQSQAAAREADRSERRTQKAERKAEKKAEKRAERKSERKADRKAGKKAKRDAPGGRRLRKV
jgi:Spy/CpxP family protein refolding chaperone